jgi:hypothetical protein
VMPWQLLMMIHWYIGWFLKKDPLSARNSDRFRPTATGRDFTRLFRGYEILGVFGYVLCFPAPRMKKLVVWLLIVFRVLG